MSNTAIAPCLKIGEVASQSGLSVKTIRYYEQIGLLAPITTRSESGYRMFTHQVLHRLSFIKRAQSLGLSLSEIQEILGVYDSGNLPCDSVKEHLVNKIEDIDKEITDLGTLKSKLLSLLSHWQEQPNRERITQTICPNIQQ